MKLAPVLAALLLLPLMLGGCEGRRAEGGTVLGAVAGGLIGNSLGRGKGKVLTTAAGVVVGGLVGNAIGKRMDEADREAAMDAEYRALEYGQSGSSTPWRNERSGRYGTVVVEKPYRRGEEHCRRYVHTVYIDGRPETMRGIACRGEGGRWEADT